MDKLTNFFKMLSDETRLRILVLLHHKKLCVCQLCGIMDESQPKISKHLAKMRDMGFVKDERAEQFIYYRLNFDNDVYENILADIVKNINNNTQLKSNVDKIQVAESYLESCKR
jgi:ArsR family transcriptional regulator, arsenate/arsenite/antimonite-responsive transcriptional repressor